MRERTPERAVARVLVRTVGRACLPALVRACSRDLGDDQDSLSMDLTFLVREDPASARVVLLPWTGDPDPDLRRTAVWLLGCIPDPADVVWLARAATAYVHRLVVRAGRGPRQRPQGVQARRVRRAKPAASA